MDPVFNPVLTYMSDSYAKAAEEGMHEYDGEIAALAPSYELLKEVIDYEQSKGCQSGSCPVFSTSDSVFTLEQGKEPSVKGTLKTACSLADALVLQYYEEPDKVKAGFGKDLSPEDWESISLIKDVYSEVLFGSKLIAVNAANPLLREIQTELNTEGRKFTFLCGHDSNVLSVLAALGVEHYELPQAIEKQTPIGCKLLFEKWVNADNEEFVRVRLVYESPEQLRSMSMVTPDTPPCSYDLTLSDIERNEDGLYRFADVMKRFDETIAAYDQLKADYAE
jgi:glucose-1-phosphatase